MGLILLVGACRGAEDPGISLELARRRSAEVSQVTVDLHLRLPGQVSEGIPGRVEIGWTVPAGVRQIVLDFRGPATGLGKALLNGRPVTPRITPGHITVDLPGGEAGRHTLSLPFTAGEGPLNRHAEFMYSLFVPARASECFPCFDQPDLKTRFRLSLDIPAAWQAMSNAPEAGREMKGDRTTVAFGQTQPISTYVFGWAAGQFQVEQQQVGSRMLRMFHRETDPEKVDRNLATLFDLHARSLDWMEQYTGVPYPFDKFDFAALPSFQYGGMEHAGAVFYRDSALLLDQAPTQEDLLQRASLVAHETAHMWFGDLVTMSWFNDVWLKEVFANFFADQMVGPSFPDLDHDLRFLLRHYPGAYRIDRTEGTHPIVQPLDNLLNAGSLYGGIIYLKAPIVMRKLKERIGAEAFQGGMRAYLKEFAWSNAEWDDLVRTLEKVADAPVEPWLDPLVRGTGLPVLAPDSRPMAYGWIPLDEEQIEVMRNRVAADERPLYRGGAWLQLHENMVQGRLAPDVFLHALVAQLPRESQAQLVDLMLGMMRETFWKYLGPEIRTRSAPGLESMLWSEMERREDPALKRSFYESVISVFLTVDMRAKLYRIWQQGVRPGGMQLSDRDLAALSHALGLRELDVREETLARLKQADRVARFHYLMPAADPDPVVRDRFFQQLADPANRAREPWVLEALYVMHHPLRENEALTHLPRLLEWLEEIKATGDIFFPMQWLQAGLSGLRSTEAAGMIRAFLDGHPDYPPDLRAKILQAADPVFRAAGHGKHSGYAADQETR